MFAVIKTGGKQYRVAQNQILTVEKLPAEAGATVDLDNVLMVAEDGEAPRVGAPYVEGAKVTAEVLEHGHDRTITVFKKRRRKNSRRTNGHRQRHTVLRVTDIEVNGASIAGGPAEAKPVPTRAEMKAATNAAVTRANRAKSLAAKKRN